MPPPPPVPMPQPPIAPAPQAIGMPPAPIPAPEPKIITVPVPVPTKEIKKGIQITPKDIAKAQASYKRPDPKQQSVPPVPPLKPGWGGGQ